MLKNAASADDVGMPVRLEVCNSLAQQLGTLTAQAMIQLSTKLLIQSAKLFLQPPSLTATNLFAYEQPAGDSITGSMLSE